MNDNLSPGFDVHRHRLEELLHTPTPHRARNKPLREKGLTQGDSPTGHILRGSKSFTVRSFRSRASGNSLRVPSNKENRSTNTEGDNSRASSGQHAPSAGPVLGEIAPNSQALRSGLWKVRPSPTPSLKKKKAEAIVKAHGSPQHVRVTAGGRIVPSEQSPLCHPRYGYSAMKVNGGLVKFAPNHPMGKSDWVQATQNGFVAQDIEGRLCQIVNGTILPLNEVDGALRLFIPAPNLNITTRGPAPAPPGSTTLEPTVQQPVVAPRGKPSTQTEPPLASQTNALELEYSKREQELKELDRTEALHGRTMGKTAKDALIGKRRELVVTLDNIRKAIKSIKETAPMDAPTSPRALQNRTSWLPPRNRLPGFLQQRMPPNEMSLTPMHPAYGPYLGAAHPLQNSVTFPFQPSPPLDPGLTGTAFAMQPPMFVPPPPFDVSISAPFLPLAHGVSYHPDDQRLIRPVSGIASELPKNDAHVPQNDGAGSRPFQRSSASPPRSHAVDIKAPEPRQASQIKSALNPMSPVYRPVKGVSQSPGNVERPAARQVITRVPTPLSPMHQLRPTIATHQPQSGSEDTISPTKKNAHLHSSSASSFETADFFPRNTREYSTRKYAYPEPSSLSEDKENISPPQCTTSSPPTPDRSQSISGRSGVLNYVPSNSPASEYNTMAPLDEPEATRTSQTSKPHVVPYVDLSTSNPPSKAIDFAALPNRRTHNTSPKTKRTDYLFVHEDPSKLESDNDCSPEKNHACQGADPSPRDSIDFSAAPVEWIEGYRAGLARRPVDQDVAGDFLDGYCAGLLKSKSPTNIGPSTGSPTKPVSRRPSPVVFQSRSPNHTDQTDAKPKLPPFEKQLKSMDTLKEAVFAPSNENAILSPASDGPLAADPPFNLGAWTEGQVLIPSSEPTVARARRVDSGFPFSERTASMIQRQGIVSVQPACETLHNTQTATTKIPLQFAPSTSKTSKPSDSLTNTQSSSDADGINGSSAASMGHRISSITSIESNLYRPWPGSRVFSPHLDWRSATSVAQATALASGQFAQAQSDGKASTLPPAAATLTLYAGTTSGHRAPSITSNPSSLLSNPVMRTHSRFKEGSLDGITNPPNSPQSASPPVSPTLSAVQTPTKDNKKGHSPTKGSTPAKAKFEILAEKVGIKATSSATGPGAGKKEDDSSAGSPQGKRRWRDVWRGTTARKDVGMDESAAV